MPESISIPLLPPIVDISLPLITVGIAFIVKWALPALTWALGMWIHELGHATTAWFSGVAATPFLGWTSIELHRTWTVTLCFTVLMGLLGYKSWQNKSYFLVITFVLAIGAQFYFRFILREEQLDFMFSYMGIGGEFWISTWLMIAYFYRFPEYTQWNVLRYAVLLIASIVFVNAVCTWHQISRGNAEFPWGSLWGGENIGDMNVLRDEFGWQTLKITNSYVRFGMICTIILSIHYVVQLGKIWILKPKRIARKVS